MFSENDMVWVKWKNWPQLPGLIKHVYQMKRQLTCIIFYTNEVFAVGFSNVMQYCDAKKEEITKSVEMMSEEHRNLFNHSVEAAEQYIAQHYGNAEYSPRKQAAADTVAVSMSGKKILSFSSGEATLTPKRCASELPKVQDRNSTFKRKVFSKTTSKSCSELNLEEKQNNVPCVDPKETVVDNNVSGASVGSIDIETSSIEGIITHVRNCKKSRKRRRTDNIAVELEDNTKAKAMSEQHLNITADQSVLDCSLPTRHPSRNSSSSSVSYDPNVDASHSESDFDEDLPLGLTPLPIGKPAAADTVAVRMSGKKRSSFSSGEATLTPKRRCDSELPKHQHRNSTFKRKVFSKTKSKSCSELNLEEKQNNVPCVDPKETVVDNNVSGASVGSIDIETSSIEGIITHVRNCKKSRKRRRTDNIAVEDNTKAKAVSEQHLNITTDESVLDCSLPTPHPSSNSSSSSVSYDPNVDASHSESDSDEDLPLGLTPLPTGKQAAADTVAVSRSGKNRLSFSNGEATLTPKTRCASELPKVQDRNSTSKRKVFSKTKSKSCNELNLEEKQNNVPCVDPKETVVDNNVSGASVGSIDIETSSIEGIFTHVRNCKKSRKRRRTDNIAVEHKDKTKAKAMSEQHLNITADESVLDCSLPTPHPSRNSSSSSVSYDPNVDASHSESDSDEDLPLGLTPLPTGKRFSKSDVVWVKWRNWPQLPAVVENVYSKKRRVRCKMFTTNELFTVGYRNALPYCDPKRAQIMESVQKMSSEDRKFFCQCVDEADSFITKECLKDLPSYASSNHDKEIETYQAIEQHTVDTNDVLDTTTTTNKRNEMLKTSTPSNKRRKQRRSEPDCKIIKVEKDKFSLSKKGELRLQKMLEKNKPLVEFLISDETKVFVTKIYKREIKSDLHDFFINGTVRQRATIKHRGFGPLDDDDQIEEVLQHFLEWLQKLKGQKYVLVDYIFDVWIPEAIVFALIKLKGYGRKRAWEQFDKGVRRTKEELRIMHYQLMDRDYSREDPLSTKPKDFILN